MAEFNGCSAPLDTGTPSSATEVEQAEIVLADLFHAGRFRRSRRCRRVSASGLASK